MTTPDATRIAKPFLGLYLVTTAILFTYFLIELWPIVRNGQEQGWAPDVTMLFGPPFKVDDDIRLLLIVILSGAVGSLVHATTSFVTYVGNKSFVSSWTWWYVLRPVIGMALALVFYFVIRGGLLSVQSNAADFNPYGTAAVAGLVGIFSKQATDKLEEVFTNLFRTEKGKGDDQRRDKLGDTVPVTDTMVPLKKIKRVTLPADKTEQDIKLGELCKILREGVTRVPIFDDRNVCKYIIHQSLIYKYIALQAMNSEPSSSRTDATLADFIASDGVAEYVRDALAFVSPTATMGEAQAEMEKDDDCQDVLVTTTGRPDAPVVGWLTNVDIVRHMTA